MSSSMETMEEFRVRNRQEKRARHHLNKHNLRLELRGDRYVAVNRDTEGVEHGPSALDDMEAWAKAKASPT